MHPPMLSIGHAYLNVPRGSLVKSKAFRFVSARAAAAAVCSLGFGCIKMVTNSPQLATASLIISVAAPHRCRLGGSNWCVRLSVHVDYSVFAEQ